MSFADELKKECQIMLDALGKKADIIRNDQDKCFYRRLLVAWGETMRELNPDYWLDKVVDKIKNDDIHDRLEYNVVINRDLETLKSKTDKFFVDRKSELFSLLKEKIVGRLGMNQWEKIAEDLQELSFE